MTTKAEARIAEFLEYCEGLEQRLSAKSRAVEMFKALHAPQRIEDLIAERDRLRAENKKLREGLPTLAAFQAWKKYADAPFVFMQARNPGSVGEPSEEVKTVQRWITKVLAGMLHGTPEGMEETG